MSNDTPNPVLAIQDRRDALERVIGRDVWSQVAALISDEVDYYEQRLAEIIAAHLPGVGPAVMAVAHHSREGDPESGCCGLPACEYGWTP